MPSSPPTMELRNPTAAPVTAGNEQRPGAVRRRYDRGTLGFWLGGVTLGTAGCILGACMPSYHPAAVAISVFWWGVYLGCLGASAGAVIALFTERTPSSPSQEPDGDGVANPVSVHRLERTDRPLGW